jgi:23S rRNA maturation-related 3'-5' exoribonuclease YhaM
MKVTIAESHRLTANEFKDLSTILQGKNITIKQIVYIVRIRNATNFKRQKLVHVEGYEDAVSGV